MFLLLHSQPVLHAESSSAARSVKHHRAKGVRVHSSENLGASRLQVGAFVPKGGLFISMCRLTCSCCTPV